MLDTILKNYVIVFMENTLKTSVLLLRVFSIVSVI